MANIKANKLGGEWDFDKLANEFELDELLEWGFTPFELGMDAEEVDYDELWQGMPEYDKDGKAFRTIHVHFENPESVEEFGKVIDQQISEKNTLWFPPRDIEHYADLEFTNES